MLVFLRSMLLCVSAASLLTAAGACSAGEAASRAASGTGVPPDAGPEAGADADVPPGPTSALVNACTEYHAAHRAWFGRCEGYPLDAATVASATDACARHAALPGMTVTPAELHACAASIEVATCGYLPPACLSPDSSFGPSRTWSVRVLPAGSVGPYYDYTLFPRSQGAAALGAPCDFSDQCQSGLCSGGGYACGVCARAAKPGEACSASVVCAEGSCTDGACVGGGIAAGQACTLGPKGGPSGCASATYCASADAAPSAPGLCEARLAAGAACVDYGGAQNACVDGALCRQAKCVAITTHKEGEACDGDVVGCEEGVQCVQSVCRKPTSDVPLGGACTVDRCAPGLYCDQEWTCASPHAVGDACAPDRLCAPDAMCSAAGVCGAMPGEGETCNPGAERCRSGMICGDFTCVRLGGDGAACPQGFGCDAPFACRDDVCRPIGFCSAQPAP